MKRIITIAIVIVFLTSCSKTLIGDANQDGKVTEADVLAIQEHIKGVSTLSETQHL